MILAIDTATRILSVALVTETQILGEHTWTTANQHSVELSPAIAKLFEQTETSAQDLTAIAVAQGPGSFTGVRIGMGVAKGMALALQIPLIAIPTLDIVAAATPYFKGDLVVIIHAGRGRIISQHYAWQKRDWQPSGDLQLTTWGTLVETIDKSTMINGELDIQGQIVIDNSTRPIQLAPIGFRPRRAGFLGQLAFDQLDQDEIEDVSMVMPLYIKTEGG